MGFLSFWSTKLYRGFCSAEKVFNSPMMWKTRARFVGEPNNKKDSTKGATFVCPSLVVHDFKSFWGNPTSTMAQLFEVFVNDYSLHSGNHKSSAIFLFAARRAIASWGFNSVNKRKKNWVDGRRRFKYRHGKMMVLHGYLIGFFHIQGMVFHIVGLKLEMATIPIGSMYGLFTYIYRSKNKLFMWVNIQVPWILWDTVSVCISIFLGIFVHKAENNCFGTLATPWKTNIWH